MNIAAAILAAGSSSRLGRPKQLLPFRGTTLLRAVAEQTCAASFDRVAVVLGAHAGTIAPTLDGLPLAPLANVLWTEGVASSIRCAVAWALRSACDAILLLVCDQPRLTSSHLENLLSAYRASRRRVASRYANIVGVPAVFDRADFPRLGGLSGDAGAQCMLEDANIVEWPDGALDIDTPEQAAWHAPC
jgi:CTP:molybdopterin cytidylyltransferase MocA